MFSIELDTSGKVNRLDEIKAYKLHNRPISNSGFMVDVVHQQDRKPVIMSHILNDGDLIGWAYIRGRHQVDNMVRYDAGSYVLSKFRGNRLATSALKSLVSYGLSTMHSDEILQIKACDWTLYILEHLDIPNFQAIDLFSRW